MTDTEQVYNHWNSKKVRGNKWKSHNELTYETKQAIQSVLRKYSLENIISAIDNYAKVLLGREFKWSYAWTLYQYLTRHNPNQRQELQLYRWLPSNFYEEDYYSEKYRKHLRQNSGEKEVQQSRRDKVISVYSDESQWPTEKLIKLRNNSFVVMDMPFIEEIIQQRTLNRTSE